jgi:hypothetical protein
VLSPVLVYEKVDVPLLGGKFGLSHRLPHQIAQDRGRACRPPHEAFSAPGSPARLSTARPD